MTHTSLARNIQITLLLTFLDNLALGLLLPVIPFWILYHGGDSTHVTLDVTLFALGTLIFSSFSGYLSDLKGRKVTVTIFLILSILANFGLFYAGAVWVILFFRFMSGAGAAKEPALIALIAEYSETKNKPMALARISTAKALGAALGPILVSLIAVNTNQTSAQFENVILLSIGLLILSLCTSSLLSDPPDTGPSLSTHNNIGFIDAIKKGIKTAPDLLIIRFSMGAINAIILAVTVLYVYQRFQWGIVETGYLYSIMVLVLVLTRLFIAPRLIQALSASVTTCLIGGIFSICLLLLSQLPGLPLFCLIFLIISVCNAILPPTILVLFDDIATNKNRASLLGLGSSAFALGQVVTGIVSGYSILHFGLAPPYIFAASILLLALLVFYHMRIKATKTLNEGIS